MKSLSEIKDKHLGKLGDVKRDEYEVILKIEIEKVVEGYKDRLNLDLDSYPSTRGNMKDKIKNATLTKKFKDYILTYEKFDEKTRDWLNLYGEILAFHIKSKQEVANSTWGEDNGMEATIDVHPNHQRKGVATQIYSWIEEIEGRELSRGSIQSDDAKAFWKNRENNRKK